MLVSSADPTITKCDDGFGCNVENEDMPLYLRLLTTHGIPAELSIALDKAGVWLEI
jgi:hypothetical protein